MSYKVTFIREQKTIEVNEETTVLEAQIRAGLLPDAPCGGQGTCGKCTVRIDGAAVRACAVKVDRDMTVDTQKREAQEAILTEGFSVEKKFDPSLQIHEVHLEKAAAGESRSDWERLIESLEKACEKKLPAIAVNLALASRLYECQKERQTWYAVHTKDVVLDLLRESRELYALAFDLGTTTLAGYLLRMSDGKTVAAESRKNPQAQFGADVISRANYALEHGVQSLSGCIRGALCEMARALCARQGIAMEDVYQTAVVGNTCMHHLFLGISPAALVHAPYTPAVRERLVLRARDYGMEIHPQGQLLMLPNIAGFVGADTCGCLLALHPERQEEISLLVDIGTNGEIVLGNRTRLAACSTAAGPAFEGAKIECGMRGVGGAIDHVAYCGGAWKYSTIGGEAPRGLCGSGLIDLVAELYRTGHITESGRLCSGQEQEGVFVLVPAEEGAQGKSVYLTQKDVSEVQLAKAAIAAGIRLLRKELGVREDEIARVWIAGAFGNYMRASSACAIGLLPASLEKRVIPVGNAAGEGAKLALQNSDEFCGSDALVKQITFVELAASPEFQDCYVDELAFPEVDR